MPEAAGPVHDEEKAKSLVRLLTNTHQFALTSVLGLQAGLSKHMHQTVGLDGGLPGWCSLALASAAVCLNE